jgi:hypothetical protein
LWLLVPWVVSIAKAMRVCFARTRRAWVEEIRCPLMFLWMGLLGMDRIFHLESERDRGLALLTGGWSVPTRHDVGSWFRHVGLVSVRRFLRATTEFKRGIVRLFVSIDEHVVARWTRKFNIRKGWHSIRNRQLKAEKLYTVFGPGSGKTLWLWATRGHTRLAEQAKKAVAMIRRVYRPKRIRLLLDAGAARSDAEIVEMLDMERCDTLLRAPRRPNWIRRWKDIPEERFERVLEPGPHTYAPAKVVYVAETRTVLKGPGGKKVGIRTIVAREGRKGGRKDCWHGLLTRDERTPAYDLIREFRTRQGEEQSFRIGVHDVSLDAVASGYHKHGRIDRPGFRQNAITLQGWLKMLAQNLLLDFSRVLPEAFLNNHPRTLRRWLLHLSGMVTLTDRDVIVSFAASGAPTQLLDPVIRDINARRVRVPWLGNRRLSFTIGVSHDEMQYPHVIGGKSVWC